MSQQFIPYTPFNVKRLSEAPAPDFIPKVNLPAENDIMSTNMSNSSIHTITAVAHGGYGICRIDGQVCFVPYALPGDSVRVRIVRRTKGVLWGQIEQICEPSPDRIEPPCGCFGACGGCTWLHFAYPAQAQWKQRIVRDSLERIARVEADIARADDPARRLNYRTRAEFHLQNGRMGFYALNTHSLVDIENCLLCHDNLNAALRQLRPLSLKETEIEITVNPEGPDVMVWTQRPRRGLEKHFSAVDWPGKYGARAQFVFDGIPIVNGTFSQSSLLLNRVLKRVVRERVGTPERLLDLYCGNGNFSLDMPESTRVVGLDHSGAAVDAAARVRPDSYRVADEETFAQTLAEPWDTIVLDPPRTGAKAIMERLARADAQTIVYVSCDPATLARDLKTLLAHGWNLRSSTAVDIFPNTPHIETVCQLQRR